MMEQSQPQSFSSSSGNPGIYPDILHICDLQIIPDVISSTLLELVDNARSKDQALNAYRIDYEQWCKENGTLTLAFARMCGDWFCFCTLGMLVCVRFLKAIYVSIGEPFSPILEKTSKYGIAAGVCGPCQ